MEQQGSRKQEPNTTNYFKFKRINKLLLTCVHLVFAVNIFFVYFSSTILIYDIEYVAAECRHNVDGNHYYYVDVNLR